MPFVVENKATYKGHGVWIGRGSDPQTAPFGNPFTWLNGGTLAKYQVANREEAVAKYQDWLLQQWEDDEYFRLCASELVRQHLKGQKIHLVCVCKPLACHGDVLMSFLEGIANLGIVTLDDAVKDQDGDLPF